MERKKERKNETKERTKKGKNELREGGKKHYTKKKNRKGKVKNFYFMSTSSSVYFLLFTHSFSDDSSSVAILFHK